MHLIGKLCGSSAYGGTYGGTVRGSFKDKGLGVRLTVSRMIPQLLLNVDLVN